MSNREIWENSLFGSYALGVHFRPFQQKILDTVKGKLKKGQRQIHIVSPPGTGKTLMGLAIIELIGQKAIVLCPNTTIQEQWKQKALIFMEDTDGLDEQMNRELGFVTTLVSTDLESRAPVLALTYQLFAAREEERRETERTFSLLLAEGYRTIILDECHHLTGRWADILHAFIKNNPGTCVVGLTATPPIDRSEKEHRRFLSIVGKVDVEIPLPAVIRDGLLAPFQDLAYFVHPTEEEREILLKQFASIRNMLDVLKNPGEGLDSLELWVEQRILNPFWKGKEYGDFLALSLEVPAFAYALIRFARSTGILLTQEVFDPEITPRPLGLDDLALILHDYIVCHLGNGHHQLKEMIQERMFQVGYKFYPDCFTKHSSLLDRTITLSSAKLTAMQKILEREIRTMGDEIRALVLTDFIHSHGHGETSSFDLFDPGAGGAIAAFRALIAHPVTDTLDPVLVTGKVILVDDEIKDKVIAFTAGYLEGNGINAHIDAVQKEDFYIFKGEGPGWGTRTYVQLITRLLQEGITRCIVGTRALFGEGWDCEPLNTLIDLTAVTSFVSVNQIRGRSLRLDPDKSSKTANNWDIVAIIPDIIGGERDLDRFFKKHERFYGPTDDGDLEKGAGHVHPFLTHGTLNKLVENMENINNQLLDWSANRARAFTTWKVGSPYRGEEISSLELFTLSGDYSQEVQESRKKKMSGKENNSFEVIKVTAECSSGPGEGHLIKGGFFILLGFLLGRLFGVFSFFPWLSVVYLPLMFFFLGHLNFRAQKKKFLSLERGYSFSSFISLASEAVALTLKELEVICDAAYPDVGQRADKSLRVKLENAPEKECLLFMQAMEELLGGYDNQRYLLVCLEYELTQPWWFPFTWARLSGKSRRGITFPVPSVIGSHRKNVDLLETHWTRLIGVCKTEYLGSRSRKRELLPVLMPLTARRPQVRRRIHRLWR